MRSTATMNTARRAASLLLLFALAALLPVASLAQGMTPVGEVKDHPVSPPSSARGGGTGGAAARVGHGGAAGESGEALNLNDMPQESMQSLFNWAIENSDPEKLREMAEAAKAGKGGGFDAAAGAAGAVSSSSSSSPSPSPSPSHSSLPDSETASKVQPGQRWTQEEVEEKRENVKEFLKMLSMNPTEQSYIKLATEMYADKTLPTGRRLMALEELEDLIGPVDNADDLHVLGALAPLVATTVDVHEDADVAAAAAGVLATAMSNNPKVQALVHAWRPSTPENVAAAAAAAAAAASSGGGGAGEDGSTDNEAKRRLTAAANAEGLHGVIDVASPVRAEDTVVAKLAAIASDPAASPARRSKSLFALSAMVRNTFACRRAFFAAGGAATMETLLQPRQPAGLRKKALVLVTDFWILPDVAGGINAAEQERLLAAAVMPHVVEMMGGGPPDTREKAMAALRAALDGDGTASGDDRSGGGSDGSVDDVVNTAAKDARATTEAAVVAAAARHGAELALFKLQEYFAAAAREDPDVGDYMTDLAQEAAALAERLSLRQSARGGGGGGGGRDEL